MIFLLENSDIQRKEEPWKIFQRYLVNGLYFPGESYKTRKYYETLLISTGVEFQHFSGYNTSENVYNFSKMIIKHIIHIEDWGISSMTERQFSLNKVMVSFTYWDYIQAFNKVLCYNNERHKHTWFIKSMCQDICESYTKLVFKLVLIPRANNKNIARTISQVIQRMGQGFPRSQQVISSRKY